MQLLSAYFRKYGCFQSEWAGFQEFKPVTVIVGKNNSGKSHLLHFVEILARGDFKVNHAEFLIQTSALKRDTTDRIPKRSQREADAFLSGSVWWQTDSGGKLKHVLNSNQQQVGDPQFRNESVRVLSQVWPRSIKHPILRSEFVNVAAERDIKPEAASDLLTISSAGSGATNVIRRFLTSSNDKLPHELIQEELLGALNQILSGDADFTGIQIRVHDEGSDIAQSMWEIFLEENHKGYVPLSSSGSGLKTVIHVLLCLLVVPKVKGVEKSRITLGFEELENNLHPSALRRLLSYIESYAVKHQCRAFITTHSSVTVDRFALSKHAQIIHVRHDGKSAKADRVVAHFDRVGIVSDLGAKPSDLLQANCLIWVEGRSDAIYVNRWIELWGNGRFVEGRDYQCVFYGGAALAGVTFAEPSLGTTELLEYIAVNPNVIVICDSDRERKGAHLKERVRRIRAELADVPDALLWITAGTEIENYLPGSAIARAFNKVAHLPFPEQYEPFFPRKSAANNSYLERRLKRKTVNKVQLAVNAAPHLDKKLMSRRFDWARQMDAVCSRIERWNADPTSVV